MIAARQLGFLGKVVRGPHDAPARRMLTACCQHKRKRGRPYLHNKDVIVRNLCLLFAQILPLPSQVLPWRSSTTPQAIALRGCEPPRVGSNNMTP